MGLGITELYQLADTLISTTDTLAAGLVRCGLDGDAVMAELPNISEALANEMDLEICCVCGTWSYGVDADGYCDECLEA